MKVNKILIFTLTFFFLLLGYKWFYLPTRKTHVIAPLSFTLLKANDEIGLKHIHSSEKLHPSLKNIEPWIHSLGASVSVVDINNDGFYDIYLTTQNKREKNQLFINKGDGTFLEAADKYGIGHVNSPYPSFRGLFLDYDNDGFKDLILLSYCPRVFHNEGMRFSELKDHGIKCGPAAGGANVIPNNDRGFDLIIAPYLVEDFYYKPLSTKLMPDNFYRATSGVPIFYYRIGKNGHFNLDVTARGLQHKGWGHTVGVYDIRDSGKKDVWFPKDYGTEKIFFNKDGENFSQVQNKILEGAFDFGRNGMGIDFADVDNDGKPLIFVTHIFSPSQKLAGNNLWKWLGENKFKQEADRRDVINCQWAWGTKFVDFDNDSFLDLIVVNGFISANPKKNYWYNMNVLETAGDKIQEDIKNWPAMADYSLDGYQRSCLYFNDHNGKFVDVIRQTGMADDLLDGRGVAAIDYRNDGSPSLIIANQNNEARFYKNIQKNKNEWIGFKFKGTVSNIDGWGVKVKVFLKDKVLSRELEPLNGHATQNEDRLLIGLGEKPQIESVQVEWPSHIRQTVKDFKTNSYNLITEPAQ